MSTEDLNAEAQYSSRVQDALAKHYSERTPEEDRLVDEYFNQGVSDGKGTDSQGVS